MTKARPGLHYAPVPGGVYFAGARAQFVMQGSDLLFTVADVCVPLLEDGATEDELVRALGSERARPAVRHVTEGLRRHGLLLDPAGLTEPEPPAAVRERHEESLALLESLSADPYAAFARLRAVTVALAGPAEAVKPAARGLARAGVRQVLVLDADADADGGLPAEVDAVLACVSVTDELPAGRADGGPVTVVPVLVDDRLLLVGPVVRDAADRRAWTVLRDRALRWAEAAGSAGPSRPVADALAGALAAQLLFESVTGVAEEGEFHVVHGPELAAERLIARQGGGAGRAVAASAEPAWRRLADAGPAAAALAPVTAASAVTAAPASAAPATTAAPMTAATPDPDAELDADAALELAAALTQPWTGLLELLPGETLPQMPLALREAETRSGRPGAVAGWGTDQRAATVATALAALRHSLDPGTEGSVPAAGLSEEAWLLDGALRLLVGSTLPLRTLPPGVLAPRTQLLWKELDRVAAGPRPVVTLRQAPGVGWLLARIESAAAGTVLGEAWGPDADTAVHQALGTALARAQVRELAGGADRVPLLNTDALSGAPAGTLAALRRQLSASRPGDGRAGGDAPGYRGRAVTADPVLGELPLWFGPVELVPAEPNPVKSVPAEPAAAEDDRVGVGVGVGPAGREPSRGH